MRSTVSRTLVMSLTFHILLGLGSDTDFLDKGPREAKSPVPAMMWQWQSSNLNPRDAMELRASPLPDQAFPELKRAHWGTLCRVHLAPLKAAFMSITFTPGPLLPLQRPSPV